MIENEFQGLGRDATKYYIMQVDVTGMSESQVQSLDSVLRDAAEDLTKGEHEIEDTVRQDRAIK
jgi:hypothetical protein